MPVLVGWTTSGTWLAGTICPMIGFSWYFHGMGAQIVQTDWYSWGTMVWFSIGSCGYHCCWQLGTKCWLHEDMYSHAVPLDTGVGPYIDSAKWGNGDFLCGANQTFDVIESELLHLHSVTLLRGACSTFCHLTFVWAAIRELQWPQHDCPKVSLSPCHCSLCKLSHSHETQIFVNYLCAHHNWNCLGVGHGGDIQQQHILIIISYPWNLQVYLHKSEVWDGCTPIPSSSNK